MTRRLRAEALTTFRSLESRNFRLFYLGQGISQIGTWMQMVAIGVLVLDLTDSGIAVGLAAAAQFGPMLLLGAWAGLLSDRADRLALLLRMQAAGAVVGVLLAALVLSGQEQLWSVFLLAAAFGTASALENPARRAFVVDLVAEDQVANAVGLNTALMTGSRIFGPAIAGALIAGPGVGWCFLLNAISYLPQIALFLRMDRAEFRVSERVVKAKGQLREGLRYVWGEPELKLPLILIAVVGTLAFNYSIVLLLFATRDLDGTPSTFTLLFSVMSIGSVMGALSIARRTSANARFLARSSLAMGVATFALTLAPSAWLAFLLVLPLGFTSVFVISGSNAVVQLHAIPEMRGRALALTAVVFIGSTPIGGPIAGWVSEEWGARAGLAMGGLAALGAGAGVLWALERAKTRARPLPEPDEIVVPVPAVDEALA